MTEITIYPSLVVYVWSLLCLLAGGILVGLFFLTLKTVRPQDGSATGVVTQWNPAWFIGGLICLSSAGISTIIRWNVEDFQTQKMKFTELPVEWQEFSNRLDELEIMDLRTEAIRRFVKSSPPRITVDNYHALSGLYIFGGWRSDAQVAIARWPIESMVILDFAEGKQ